MNKEIKVEINRENAMKIWVKRYGKVNVITDYTGRTIHKGAYDDRKSKFGWNLDHGLPKSQGGKDTEANLFCTHILTNDEKANKYPGFTANNKQFNVIKVENHYEIQEVKKNEEKQIQQSDETADFKDFSYGLKVLNTMSKGCFTADIFIKLYNLNKTFVIDFILEIFDEFDFEYDVKEESYYNNYLVKIKINDTSTKALIQELLDTCITCNTYLQYYIQYKKYCSHSHIFYGVNSYSSNFERMDSDYFDEGNFNRMFCYKNRESWMMINNLVKINTSANKELKELEQDFYDYNYYWTKLKENLEKESNK